jgi:hypothetical protein
MMFSTAKPAKTIFAIDILAWRMDTARDDPATLATGSPGNS